MTEHIRAAEIGETPDEQIELLRANAAQFMDDSPCLWGLMMRAADTIEAMLGPSNVTRIRRKE